MGMDVASRSEKLPEMLKCLKPAFLTSVSPLVGSCSHMTLLSLSFNTN